MGLLLVSTVVANSCIVGSWTAWSGDSNNPVEWHATFGSDGTATVGYGSSSPNGTCGFQTSFSGTYTNVGPVLLFGDLNCTYVHTCGNRTVEESGPLTCPVFAQTPVDVIFAYDCRSMYFWEMAVFVADDTQCTDGGDGGDGDDSDGDNLALTQAFLIEGAAFTLLFAIAVVAVVAGWFLSRRRKSISERQHALNAFVF